MLNKNLVLPLIVKNRSRRAVFVMRGQSYTRVSNAEMLPCTHGHVLHHRSNTSPLSHLSSPPGLITSPIHLLQQPDWSTITVSFFPNTSLALWNDVMLHRTVSFNSAHRHGDPPIRECAAIYVAGTATCVSARTSLVFSSLPSICFSFYISFSLPLFSCYILEKKLVNKYSGDGNSEILVILQDW